MTAGRFWELQQFSYVETYSFNRDPKRATVIRQAKEELRVARYMRQPALRQLVERLESGIYMLTQGLEHIHPTATRVAKIDQSSAQGQQLAAIFRQAGKPEWYAMCAPIYRDALAFYDAQGQLVRVLNICFECQHMQADTGSQVEADEAVYQALRLYLAQLGHPMA
jgi:hypothetical protein